MNTPSAILFDLDDTLYDYREYRRSGFRAVADQLGTAAGIEPDDLYGKLIEVDSTQQPFHPRAFDELIRAFELPRSWLDEMVALFRHHDPEIHPFPGVREMLAELGIERGIPLFLVTEGIRGTQERKIRALGLYGFFLRVSILEPPMERKEATQVFKEIRGSVSAHPASIWVIGDNPAKDFHLPGRMGMTLVHVVREGEESCLFGRPHLHLSRTADLLSLLNPERAKRSGSCTAIE